MQHISTVPMNRRKELLYKSTPAEKAVCLMLQRLGLTFVRQMPIRTAGGKTFYADIFIPSLRLVIEVDGQYHFTASQRRKDENRSKCIRRMGLHVYRFCNTTASSPESLVSLLKRHITRQKRQFPRRE